MSRWLGKICRRFYHLSLFIDWDRHQTFHIWMACLGLFFSTMHSLAHLTGTVVYAIQPSRREQVARALRRDDFPTTYWGWVCTRPGWTGALALLLFFIMAISGIPSIRRRNYEVFQACHLLAFPFVGLCAAHGTARLLQFPMLGFWLAIPTVLITFERLHRIYRGFFHRTPCTVKILDNDTVTITCHERNGQPWRWSAGQFIFINIPAISRFQWHPFTVSHCAKDVLQLHVKTDGNWTQRLRNLPPIFEAGIDGPFGAPAQRFYEYDRSVIIGTGVGITPFSAIISDLQLNIHGEDGWSRHRSRRMSRSRALSRAQSRNTSPHARTPSLSSFDGRSTSRISSHSGSPLINMNKLNTLYANESWADSQQAFLPPCSRRVDFHWMVRERNSLRWFSDLLNRAYDMSKSLPIGSLDLNIHTYVTLGQKSVSEHIFSYLLDEYRTETHQTSTLTGLKARSQFSRPDFDNILRSFHEDVRHEVQQGVTEPGQKIAVFFCGAPVLGTMLRDLCSELTIKGRKDGSRSRWDFKMEVFG